MTWQAASEASGAALPSPPPPEPRPGLAACRLRAVGEEPVRPARGNPAHPAGRVRPVPGPAPERHPLRPGPAPEGRSGCASLAELKPDLVVNTGDNLSHAKARGPPAAGAAPPDGISRACSFPAPTTTSRPSLKNPASYLLGPSKASRKTRRSWTGRGCVPSFGMSGWVDLTNRCQSRGAEGHALRLLRRRRSAPAPGAVRRLAPRHQGPGRRPAPARRRRPRPLPARAGPLHRGRRRPAAGRPHPRRPDLRPGLRRPRRQLRPPHLAGQGPATTGKATEARRR